MLIAGGGALGALMRYAVSGLTHTFFGETFPWGTLMVNLVGSFLIGVGWAISERIPHSPHLIPFLFIGLLGAFTTFSTYALESFNLIRDGEFKLGVLNMAASNIVGLLVVFLGFVCARYFLGQI